MTIRKKRLALGGAGMLLAAAAMVWFFPWCRSVAALPAVPDSLPAAMVYLLIHSRKTWWNGAAGTLAVSFLGTILGFALAVLLTLQRTVELSRRDSALLKIVKIAGQRLEMLYVAVIRGTPMMVQACIIYYSGFATAKALMPGASITERVRFNEIPPHVEYSFTQKGRDLMPVFYAMMNWGFAYDEENEAIEKP